MNRESAGWWTGYLANLEYRLPEIRQATLDTIYMVLASTGMALAFGLLLAVLMILAHPRGLRPKARLYRTVDWLVNIGRSFPFIILLIAIQPLTRLVVGTTIGTTAMIVPLTIGATPFAARILEGCLLEVDPGIVEAARSFGAGDMHIVCRVLFPEALPSIVLNIAVIAISLLGYSAMAGTVGGGGLGDLAINYGYHRFQPDIMFCAVAILVVMVQCIQSICGFIYRRIK
ncbi:MAG: ABC transporter permease [Planctomycetes bacterium]|nr:ABC transporter permease [Planctomycetota bacterium]